MGNLSDFDAESVDGDFGYSALPAGNYSATLESSESKRGKSGDSEYIQFTWVITDGSYSGRKVWDIVMRKHSNPTVVQIGNRKLKALVDLFGPALDTSEWHDRELILKVTQRVDKSSGEIQNQIAGYSIQGLMKPAPTKAVDTNARKANGSRTPWGK
jgi:hypothetical protein